MGITNPFSRQRRCHTIHLLRRLAVILIVVFVRLHLLLLSLPLIKRIRIEYRGNQLVLVLVLVCYASTTMRVILFTELILW
jgi:hypothetical protein